MTYTKILHSPATTGNLSVTFILVYMISLLVPTTHIVIWRSASVIVLKYETQKGSTEAMGVATLYIIAYIFII